MFTGIIQTIAEVAWITHSPKMAHYGLNIPPAFLSNLAIGASVNVHGICQTVVGIENNCVRFDAIEETLTRTTIGSFAKGQRVNIERAAKLGDEIGGHLLSGHVVGTALITNLITPLSEQRILRLSCPPEWMKYILPKGFIALNGASLTVVDTDPQGYFTVHLIPETLRATTFGQVSEGERVHVEIDTQTQAIVDTVERFLAHQARHP